MKPEIKVTAVANARQLTTGLIDRPVCTYSQSKKALGEVDTPNMTRVSVPASNKKNDTELVWVRILTGDHNDGTGAVDHVPYRLNGILRLGQVIRFKRKLTPVGRLYMELEYVKWGKGVRRRIVERKAETGVQEAEYADFVPTRVHTRNQVESMKVLSAQELLNSMLFNPAR